MFEDLKTWFTYLPWPAKLGVMALVVILVLGLVARSADAQASSTRVYLDAQGETWVSAMVICKDPMFFARVLAADIQDRQGLAHENLVNGDCKLLSPDPRQLADVLVHPTPEASMHVDTYPPFTDDPVEFRFWRAQMKPGREQERWYVYSVHALDGAREA